MKTQIQKIGYCKLEKKKTNFIQTLSPTGFWVCTSCRYRTSKLLKEPDRWGNYDTI